VSNVYERWKEFYEDAISRDIPGVKTAEKIAYFGIGGSGIPGEVLKLLDLPVEYKLFRSYKVNVDSKTTVVAVSYSGNTAETLAGVKRAQELGVKEIIVITSGGKLKEIAESKGYPLLSLPQGYQTRFIFPYIFTYLVRILNQSTGSNYRVQDLVDGIQDNFTMLSEVSTRIANRITGKVPIFYASDLLPIAERFKQEVNENAKYPAFFSQLPEANHNEIELYSSQQGNQFIPIVIPSDKIDEATASLINAELIYPPYKSILKNISGMFLIAGLASVKLASQLNIKAEELRIIPKIRERTHNLLMGG